MFNLVHKSSLCLDQVAEVDIIETSFSTVKGKEVDKKTVETSIVKTSKVEISEKIIGFDVQPVSIVDKKLPRRVQPTRLQRRREKSTMTLASIVVIFIACHSYRLSLKVFEFAHPQSNTMEHFETCFKLGRYHVPASIYVLTNIHHVFLVLNSSINFIIYCCVGKEFRRKLVALFCKKSS